MKIFLFFFSFVFGVSACKTEPKRISRSGKGTDYHEFITRFPLHNIKSYNFDSIEKLVSKPEFAIDSLSWQKLYENKLVPYDSWADTSFFCSIQKTGSYTAVTYLLKEIDDNYDEILWVNYDANFKPVAHFEIAGMGGDAGDVSGVSSKFINDSTIEVRNTSWNGEEEMEEKRFYKTYEYTTTETIRLRSNGTIKTLSEKQDSVIQNHDRISDVKQDKK